jgi:hypothetical protein
VEWEELLVRLEITPRALRLAVEDAGGDSPGARAVLQGALGRELWWDHILPDLRAGNPILGEFSLDIGRDGREPDAGAMAEAFARMRERNFAQVQRRGLGVWDWESPVEGLGATLTAYQVLQYIARMDGEMLASLRAARKGAR